MLRFLVVALTLVPVAACPGCKKKESEVTKKTVTVVVPPPVASPLVERGAKIFQSHCVVCHKVNGIGGDIGTDLSKVGERHDAVFLQTQLKNPALYRKDTKMPSYKDLPKEDMDSLIAYLLTLK